MKKTTPEIGPLLQADAQNRAFRIFLIGLVTAIGIDVIPFALAALESEVLDVAALVKAAIKIAVQAALGFIMRRFLDPSKFPSPLPPDPQ